MALADAGIEMYTLAIGACMVRYLANSIARITYLPIFTLTSVVRMTQVDSRGELVLCV